eukprot:218935-Chlamydomonas_euryale.AAC.1
MQVRQPCACGRAARACGRAARACGRAARACGRVLHVYAAAQRNRPRLHAGGVRTCACARVLHVYAHQGVPHAEALCHAHERIVDSRVAVWVVLPQNLAHHSGALRAPRGWGATRDGRQGRRDGVF